MKKKFDATVAGHICLDIIPEIPDTGIKEVGELFKPGKLINVNAAKLSTGGAVSNTGMALKKLGLNLAFLARIGKDEFGQMITTILAKEGETSGLSVCPEDRTSYSIVIAAPGIDRMFLHDPGANNAFTSQDLNQDIISQSKLFHFGYPPLMAATLENHGQELQKIYKIAKQCGALTSLDLSLPDPNSPTGKINWEKILANVLPCVDLFLPSVEEVFFMLDRERYFQVKKRAGANDMIDFIDYEENSRLANRCLELGTKIVALKSAQRGFYVKTSALEKNFLADNSTIDLNNWSRRELWCPAFKVERIVSATGAGDAAIAGFLAAFLRGYSIEKAVKYANCIGYQNLHALDALSGIKNWETATAFIKEKNPPLIQLSLAGFGWRWSEKNKLWLGTEDASNNRH